MFSIFDFLDSGASAGGGGALGAFLVWLGLKSRLEDAEKRISSLSKDIRFVDTCNEITKAMDRRLQTIESRQSEMCQDIKAILSKLS